MSDPRRATILYAVNAPSSSAHRAHLARQIGRSLESLRTHDRDVDVQIHAYGAPEALSSMELASLAARHRARLHQKGAYEDALARHVPLQQARVLADYGVLHKWLAVAEVDAEQVLYVDNDTYFLDVPSRLFAAYAEADFYAREEPFSSRSHVGYRPAYIDEAKLQTLAASQGARAIPTYNLGVVMLNRMGLRLAGALPSLLSFVWRLCLGIVRDVDAAGYASEDQLVRLLRERTDTTDALPYPSSNYWIVEQLALLLALGKLEPFTHDVLQRGDVVQGVEFHFVERDVTPPVVAHYYSSNTDAFFTWAGVKS